MGNLIAKLMKAMGSFKKPTRICMLGLDAAGKTTVLYRMKLQEAVLAVPTIGFNVEEIEYKNLTMTIYDVGGQDKIRRLWTHYLQNTDALIYIVDSADRERFDEARDELHMLLADENLRDVTILIYANKSDLPGAASAAQVAEAMHITTERRRPWHVQPSIATKGEGLYEGLDWLAETVNKRS